jgi:hypothetical protein
VVAQTLGAAGAIVQVGPPGGAEKPLLALSLPIKIASATIGLWPLLG